LIDESKLEEEEEEELGGILVLKIDVHQRQREKGHSIWTGKLSCL
jgi:hypothetical protein